MREIAQKLSRCSSFGALMDDAFARCPEREAIVYEDWRLTYGDLERYIHQTAHYLRHLGVRKGSRLTAEALRQYCRAHMPTFRAPKEIEIVPELPKGATGKVLTAVLRARSVQAS